MINSHFKRSSLFLFSFLLLSCGEALTKSPPKATISQNKCEFQEHLGRLQTGDIIFQESRSSQSKVIQSVTDSRWSHVGVVYRYHPQLGLDKKMRKPGLYVLEAIHPVTITPIDRWIRRGVNCDFVVMRVKPEWQKKLSSSISTQAFSRAILKEFKKFENKPYDRLFQPDDQALYCSELVSKIYKPLGLEIGQWVPIKSLHLKTRGFESFKKERLAPLAKQKNISVEELFDKGYQRGKTHHAPLKDKAIVTPVSQIQDPKLQCIVGCQLL